MCTVQPSRIDQVVALIPERAPTGAKEHGTRPFAAGAIRTGTPPMTQRTEVVTWLLQHGPATQRRLQLATQDDFLHNI
jgi:hypothetical protein